VNKEEKEKKMQVGEGSEEVEKKQVGEEGRGRKEEAGG
jgi:hypothetical protein